MKQLSTTALAKKRNIESKELFKILSNKKWIYKKDEKWQLTREGRLAGGDTKYNPKFGEYIIWPSNLDYTKTIDSKSKLNASKIGEHFNISSQKINLYLSELGWIEKDKGGWVTTNSGKKNGANQLEAMNGKPYVVWSNEILSNKHLIREIQGATGDEEYQKVTKSESNSDDFRKKFPANLRTPDGHYVRSRAEILIDDFLYKNGIVHAYERRVNIDEEMYCDFYIPTQKLYIEFWGLEENEQYAERKKKKLELYAKYNLKLIEVNNSDIENLDENLASKLRKHNIIVD
jgi:phage antirepressor YoqD-like protein